MKRKKIISFAVIFVAFALFYNFHSKSSSVEANQNKVENKVAESNVAVEGKAPTHDYGLSTKSSLIAYDKNRDIAFLLGSGEKYTDVLFYGSFLCPGCALFYNNELPKLVKMLKENKINITLRYRTFISDERVLMASLLLKGLSYKDKKEMVKTLYSTQTEWAFSGQYSSKLKKMFELKGISEEKANDLINDYSYRGELIAQRSDELTIVGLDKTPYFLINGKVYDGDLKSDELYKVITSHA